LPKNKKAQHSLISDERLLCSFSWYPTQFIHYQTTILVNYKNFSAKSQVNLEAGISPLCCSIELLDGAKCPNSFSMCFHRQINRTADHQDYAEHRRNNGFLFNSIPGTKPPQQ